MSFESNNLERDRFIATLVERYLSEGEIGDPERLVDFVLDRVELNDDVLSQLANAAIAAEFQALRLRGDAVSIENRVETYCALFDDRALTLDRADLLKRLTQRELYYVVDSPLLRADLGELQARFPEIADFFDEYFDRRRRAVFSRSVARFPSDDAPQTPPTRVSTSEHYDVELAPLAPDANRRLGKLGSGGLKDVYAARQASTNQTVALKILKNAKSTEARDSFKSEVLIQARITHPNVPEIFSFDENGVAPTLVERLIPGKSWAELLDARTFEENLATLATVSQIVAYAHEQQHIIHGDLKPENVMLGESGGRYNEVYLVDWGLARCLDDEGATTQTLGGTLDYQPPEAFAEVDLELSFATDVFMLGGILFRLLTGAAPYQNKRVAENEFEAERAAVSANVPAIPDRNPKTQRVNPQDLIEIATKALRYDPKERYENAAAFVDALERYRRRANLGERLRDAQTSLAELRADGDAASLASVSLTTLVETANEFRLLREEAARTDADDKPSRLFWEAVESERTARDLLVESALQSKDFGVVESQISVAERLESAVNDVASSEAASDAQTSTPSPADPNARRAKIADFRARLRRGLAERRRQRLAKWIAASAVLCAVGLSVWSLYEKSQKDAALAEAAAAGEQAAQARAVAAEAQTEAVARQAEAELANERAYRARLGELEQTVAPIAAENWAQGEVALRDYVDAPEEMATRLHLAERSGIFLEAAGSRRVIVDSTAFSADERYVATLGPVGTTIYRATFESPNGSFVSVAQFPFADYDGTRYLTANPAFRADAETTGEKVDPIAASRFLLCRDDGVVHFLRFDENGATATHKVDFRATPDAANGAKAATQPRASWGVPLFATTADGVRLIVADVSGAASVYAFPEGRLVKRFQLCAPSADAPNALPRLAATPDGRTLVSAGLDGSFKRWSLDGEELETFDLPLGEVDLSLGWLFRSVDVSPDGKTLYASDERGKFVVWDVDAKKPIYVGQEPVNETQAKRVGAPATTNFLTRIYRLDDARFVTLGLNDRWCVWDLSKRDENGAPTSVEFRDDSAGPSRALRSVAISPSRRFLATQNNSQYFEIYDVESQKALARSEGVLFNRNPVFTISDVAYLPQSDQILCGSFGCRPVVALDPRTLRVATEYDPYPDADAAFFTEMKGVPSFFAAPNAGDEFAVAFASGDLFFFKDGVSEPIAKLEKAFPDASIDNLPLLAASPDGSRLIGKTLLGDEYVLWDWKTRSEIKRLKLSPDDDADATQVDAEPSAVQNLFKTLCIGLEFLDKTTLATIMPDGSVVRYNVETGERVATTPSPRPLVSKDGLAATTSGAQCYRLSNDRKRLALGFADGFVAVVDL
ncbi:MAG: protein kinase, partial [Thermoguttaceae bacterium]|nr:protein kinase [Thermoguttaceae bacterium]